MYHDLLGNPVSYANRDAIAELDAAADKFLAYRADPFAAVEAILAKHPRFVLAHCFRAGLIATATVIMAITAKSAGKILDPQGTAGKAD